MNPNEQISLAEIYAVISNELEDLYEEGVISAAIYNKKTPKRLLLHAINQADKHICLKLKVKKYVSVFVPEGQKSVFFDRQKEYLTQYENQFSAIQSSDPNQYAALSENPSFMQVVSVVSQFGMAYDEIPFQESQSGIRINAGLYTEVESPDETQSYQVTGGAVKTHVTGGQKFWIDPVERRMNLSQPFDSDKWVRFMAQIAPLEISILTATTDEINNYLIRSPFFCREWLIDRTMIHLLSRRAAAAGGYYDSEAKSEVESMQKHPGTGNVIIPGNELDGNYESNFDF